MRKGFYSKWLVFIIAFTFIFNVKAQHDKINEEVAASFMDVINKHTMNITEYFNDASEFSTFSKALKATNSLSILKSDGEFTVFAPNNDAFSQLPPEVMRQLFMPENIQKLRSITDYHIVFGQFNLEAQLPKLKGIMYLTAFNNEIIKVCLEPEDAMAIYDANGYPIAITQKILLRNGAIYTIDAVIFPQVDVKVVYN